MAILTLSGRAALAAAIKSQPLHLALGEGEVHWDVEREQSGTFAPDDTLDLGYTHIGALALMDPAETLLYIAEVDYSVNASTGVITRLPTGSLNPEAEVFARFTPEHPPEPTERTTLIAEVGRRLVEETHFVEADEAGQIVVPSGRYSISSDPTRHLFVRTRFDFEDASTSVIREQGLFVGCETDPALPIGQRYFSPAQVTDAGILLLLQYSVPIVRQPSTRETFEFVVTF
ncbi:hypothetical protein U5801_21515 [Lamprobacter modestohalophilus]|uniref:hypothetical protein n=1 Tax=Lamprobacter modestohalophilus TaxID=1064514 RepID=UPI002ADEBEF5|nr:hypothetical protein [Lamprobacter modestohalophilus]MEA1052364.1 hypothetical protein [Lamprobacter modestohalophilus]